MGLEPLRRFDEDVGLVATSVKGTGGGGGTK